MQEQVTNWWDSVTDFAEGVWETAQPAVSNALEGLVNKELGQQPPKQQVQSSQAQQHQQQQARKQTANDGLIFGFTKKEAAIGAAGIAVALIVIAKL